MNNINKTKTVTLAKPISLYLCILAAILSTILLSHQQIIVGTIVNLMLLSGAINLERKQLILLAIFPSILTVFQGLLFGKFTVFLLYFLPFIWVSNFAYMMIFKNSKGNGVYRLLLSSFGKTAILFIIAILFTNIHLVPKIFLTAMGVLQLVTSLLGGGLFLIINKLEKNNVR